MTGMDLASAPSRNGHLGSDVEDPGQADQGALLGRLARGLASQVQQRIPRADLDERDPDYIREKLPLMWLAASIYFRGEVRGLGNIPDSGPVLLVGNHSGGNLTPDTTIFTLAFTTPPCCAPAEDHNVQGGANPVARCTLRVSSDNNVHRQHILDLVTHVVGPTPQTPPPARARAQRRPCPPSPLRRQQLRPVRAVPDLPAHLT